MFLCHIIYQGNLTYLQTQQLQFFILNKTAYNVYKFTLSTHWKQRCWLEMVIYENYHIVKALWFQLSLENYSGNWFYICLYKTMCDSSSLTYKYLVYNISNITPTRHQRTLVPSSAWFGLYCVTSVPNLLWKTLFASLLLVTWHQIYFHHFTWKMAQISLDSA